MTLATTRCESTCERPGDLRGDYRVVSCHLPAGHPGEHEEDGTDVTWTDRRVIRFYVSLNFDGFGGTCVWVFQYLAGLEGRGFQGRRGRCDRG